MARWKENFSTLCNCPILSPPASLEAAAAEASEDDSNLTASPLLLEVYDAINIKSGKAPDVCRVYPEYLCQCYFSFVKRFSLVFIYFSSKKVSLYIYTVSQKKHPGHF